MNIQTTIVYTYLEKSNKRITVMQGGTRSGKTYNILLWFITKLLNEKNKILTICRETTPAIKKSVLRDFMEILERLKLYNPAHWRATRKAGASNPRTKPPRFWARTA